MSALNREDLKDYSRAQIVEGQISEVVTPEKHNLVNDKLIESAINVLEDRATGADFANPLETDPPKFVAPYELFLYFLRKSDKATQAEVLAGLNNSKFITPKGLAAALVGNYGLRDYDDSGVTTYAEGVGAFYDSSLYRCNNPAGTSGAWNADDWDVISAGGSSFDPHDVEDYIKLTNLSGGSRWVGAYNSTEGDSRNSNITFGDGYISIIDNLLSPYRAAYLLLKRLTGEEEAGFGVNSPSGNNYLKILTTYTEAQKVIRYSSELSLSDNKDLVYKKWAIDNLGNVVQKPFELAFDGVEDIFEKTHNYYNDYITYSIRKADGSYFKETEYDVSSTTTTFTVVFVSAPASGTGKLTLQSVQNEAPAPSEGFTADSTTITADSTLVTADIE